MATVVLPRLPAASDAAAPAPARRQAQDRAEDGRSGMLLVLILALLVIWMGLLVPLGIAVLGLYVY